MVKENLRQLEGLSNTRSETPGELEIAPTDGSADTLAAFDTDSDFVKVIRDNGVLRTFESFAPSNLDDLITEAAKARSSPPP